jgi:hypothetical protein
MPPKDCDGTMDRTIHQSKKKRSARDAVLNLSKGKKEKATY